MKDVRWSTRTVGLLVLALLTASVAAACGDDDTTDGDGAVSVVEHDEDAGGQTTDADAEGGAAGLTIAGLCDSIDAVVVGFVGQDAETSHADLFVDDSEFPSLLCEWYAPSTTRELRVVYSLWDTWGGVPTNDVQTIEGFEPEHVYEPGSLYVHTPNGWEIDVFTWEGTTPQRLDMPDEATAVAAAALAALAAAL